MVIIERPRNLLRQFASQLILCTFSISITTFVQVVIATDNVNKINNTYMKNIPHCNTSVRSFLDWSKIEDADERESAISPITPCIQQDTGRSQYNDSITISYGYCEKFYP